MSEKKIESELVKLTIKFSEKARAYKNRNQLEDYVNMLHLRSNQLEDIYDRAKKVLITSRNIKLAINRFKIPKRKLSGRIKNIKSIAEQYSKEKVSITDAKKIDITAYEEMFNEINDKLKSTWESFAAYDKRADSFDKVDVDESKIKVVIKELNKCMFDLKEATMKLPEKSDDVENVKNIKNQIKKHCDTIEAAGLDEDVSMFLSDSRGNGFLLKNLLNTPKILEWLKDKNRSSDFIVFRKD